MDPATHIVELVGGGYVDKKSTAHTRVVFGHRITAKDLFSLDEDPAGQNPTQYNDLVIRSSIVEFGTLPMPVPLSVLLNLDSIDREDLVDGHNIFSALTADGHESEFLPDHKVRLGWGFKINDVVYNHVEFGRRVTGMEEVEADRAGLKQGIRRLCFLIGKQITKIASVEGSVAIAELDGPIPLEYFVSLDGADVATLRGAADNWRQSFRIRGARISRNGTGKDSDSPGAEAGLERAGDSRAAPGTP